MKAVLLDTYGGPENLHLKEIPIPLLNENEVLVRIYASSVNPIDLKIRAGLPIGPDLPAVLGCDFSGIVEQVGQNVTSFKVGDAVYGCAGGVKGLGGTLAEFIACDPDLLAIKPHSLTHKEAAALPLVSITAWQLVERAGIQPNEKVIIFGAVGGVGHIVLQMAKIRKAHITAVVSNQEKVGLALDLGADEVVIYSKESPEEYLQRLTQGKGFDVIIDTVGGDNLNKSFQVAATYGRIATSAARSTHDLSPLHAKALSLHVIFMLLPMLTGERRKEHGQILKDVATLCNAGKIMPILNSTVFNLSQAAEAHKLLESGSTTGKIIIEIKSSI